MLSLTTLVSFFGASLLLAVAPGPDIIFVLTQSLAYGKKAGLWVALGNVMALLVHTAAVAVGLAAIIKASPQALEWIKIVGASYLIYLAVRIFMKRGSENLDADGHEEVSTKNLFIRGAIVSLTNPQVTLLFLAFLPQFIEHDSGAAVSTQVVLLGLVFMFAAMLVFSAVALASGLLRSKLVTSPKMMSQIDRVAGVVFVVLAIRLFTE